MEKNPFHLYVTFWEEYQVSLCLHIMRKNVPSSGRSAEIPAKEEKISGAPLPRAIMVTPATFWDNLNIFEIRKKAAILEAWLFFYG